jgi:hypothetical protein
MAMIDAIRVTWESLKDLWEDLIFLIMLNLVWTLALLLVLSPLFLWGGTNPILALALSLVLFLPVPVVSGALCFVTNQISRGNAVGWETFATGLRRYWLKSLVVALINLIVLGLLVTNLQFYAFVLQGAWTKFALSAWIIVGIYWLIVQIYWFPMILELESEKVLEALRNALALVMISPGFSLGMAIILIVLAVLCIVLTVPLPLFMAVLLLLVINRATRSRLDLVRRKRKSHETKG